MRTDPRKTPSLSDEGRREQQARTERLAKALRENLKKRKAQARARQEAGRPAPRDHQPDNHEPDAGEA
jgi:hypothetical protein